jgi:hypothetical protein
MQAYVLPPSIQRNNLTKHPFMYFLNKPCASHARNERVVLLPLHRFLLTRASNRLIFGDEQYLHIYSAHPSVICTQSPTISRLVKHWYININIARKIHTSSSRNLGTIFTTDLLQTKYMCYVYATSMNYVRLYRTQIP